MSGLLNSMGVKGLAIFLLMVVAGVKLETVNLYLGIGMEAVGCLLLALYLEAIYEQANTSVDSKIKEKTDAINAEIAQVRAETQQNTASLKEELTSNSHQLNDALSNNASLVKNTVDNLGVLLANEVETTRSIIKTEVVTQGETVRNEIETKVNEVAKLVAEKSSNTNTNMVAEFAKVAAMQKAVESGITVALNESAKVVDAKLDALQERMEANIGEVMTDAQDKANAVKDEFARMAVENKQYSDSVKAEVVAQSEKLAEKDEAVRNEIETKVNEVAKLVAEKSSNTNTNMVAEFAKVAAMQKAVERGITGALNESAKAVDAKLGALQERMEANIGEVMTDAQDKANAVKNEFTRMAVENKQYAEEIKESIDAKEVVINGSVISESLNGQVAETITKLADKVEQVAKDNNQGLTEMTEKLAVIDNRITVEFAKSVEIQQAVHDSIGGALAHSMTLVDENLGVLRDSLEANIININEVRNEVTDNKDTVVKAIADHNDKLNKFLEYAKDNIQQEEIFDAENAATVFNTKKNGITIHSELRDDNQLSFMAGYKDGRMIYSKSFDENGNLTNECSYDDKGQVKERRTYQQLGKSIKATVKKY